LLLLNVDLLFFHVFILAIKQKTRSAVLAESCAFFARCKSSDATPLPSRLVGCKMLGSSSGTIMTIAALMFFVVFFATLFGKGTKQGALELIVSEPYHEERVPAAGRGGSVGWPSVAASSTERAVNILLVASRTSVVTWSTR